MRATLLIVVTIASIAVTAGCGGAGSGTATTNAPPPATATVAPSAPVGTASTPDPTRPSPGCTEPRAEGATGVPQTIDVDGTTRTFVVAAPTGTKPAPLILLLHGMGSSGADLARVSDLPNRASKAGVMVVSPDAVGSPTLWRAGTQGPDAAFLDRLIATVGDTMCVDLSRIGIVGFSVGAVMAAAYACGHPESIAAIVTVEVDTPGGCTAPLSIMAFHGTADPVVPYGPVDAGPSPTPAPGTDANMAVWAVIDGCGPVPERTEVGSEVTRFVWPSCAHGSEVVLYRIVGGAHDWPGKDPVTAVHPSTQQVSATDEAIAFITRHRLTPPPS